MQGKDWKYQFSIKLDDGHIYVVRADTREELEEEIIYIKGLITNRPPYRDDEIEQALDKVEKENQSKTFEEEMDNLDPSLCTIHNVDMKQREGKFGLFYSHPRGTYPNLEWCSGKGFPNENN